MSVGVEYDWSVRVNDEILYEPEPKPIILHTATEPNILYGGAAGGMKSHTLRWHGIISCMSIPGLQVLLLRREYTELNRTHLLSIYEEVPEQLAKWKAEEKRLEFPQRDGKTSMMHFGHCKADSDFRKHLSTEWELILVDESGELTVYMLRTLPSRLRTTKPGLNCQYILASNPGGEGHEYNYRYFISKDMTFEEDPSYDPDDFFFLYADWRDNPHIDQAAYEKRLMSLPEFERRRFMGDWEIAPDRMFPTWNRAFHVYKAWDGTEMSQLELAPNRQRVVAYKPWWPIYRSLDWGWAAPTSIGWWVVDDEGNAHRACEFYHAEIDPEDQVPRIREIDDALRRQIELHAKRAGIPCDAIDAPKYTVADPKIWDLAPHHPKGPGYRIIEEYWKAGLTDIIPGTNQRVPGWQVLRNYMNPGTTPTIYVEESCHAFIRQMGMLRRDPNYEEELADHQEDHAADDTRYFLMSRPQHGFSPVEQPWQKFQPGSAEWYESQHIHKVKTKPQYIHDPGLGPIRVR